MARARRIRTQPSHISTYENRTLVFAGWLHGKRTYLWVGYKTSDGEEHYLGTLEDQKLYRLAKAIVKQFEGSAHG